MRVLALLALAACRASAPGDTARELVCIEGVRLFDGERAREDASVCLRDGVILSVAGAEAIPADAERVPGAGRTLLPGLIDAHAHVWGVQHLRQALAFGTTTVLDMGGAPQQARTLRDAALVTPELAELRFAGFMLTAPGGHGTERQRTAPTVRDARGVDEFVAQRVAEGSDYIKIIVDDGHVYARPQPTIGAATLLAAVEATHARGLLALVHVVDQNAARQAIDAGADGLAHVFVDRACDADFPARVAARGAFVVPTLSVLESAAGRPGAPLARDPELERYIAPNGVAALERRMPATAGSQLGYGIALEAVRALHAAGVTLLAGTDSPNPGTWIGVTLHAELERLVSAGLSPVEALAAATSKPADRFRLHDRGRIAPGKRADLVLVDGDPTADIRATRRIVSIWRGGKRIERRTYPTRAERNPSP